MESVDTTGQGRHILTVSYIQKLSIFLLKQKYVFVGGGRGGGISLHELTGEIIGEIIGEICSE